MVTLDIQVTLLRAARTRLRATRLHFYADANNNGRINFDQAKEHAELAQTGPGTWKGCIVVQSERSLLFVLRWLDLDEGTKWRLDLTTPGAPLPPFVGTAELAYGQCVGVTAP
jgi:hypothetical protein